LQSSQSSQSQPLSQPLSLSSNQSQANSSVVDDVLDAVAYSTTELNDADEISVPATDHSEPSDQQTPGALGTMLSLCVKTHIVPVSTAIAALQDEVRQLRDLVAKLTGQVCDMSVALTKIAGSKSHHDNADHLQAATCPHPTPSRAALTTTAKLGSSVPLHTVGQSLSSNPIRSNADLNISQQRQEANNQQAVTAMYIDLKKKQQRSNNIVISGLPASDNDAKSVIDLLRSEFECDIEDWPGVNIIRCKRLGGQQNNKIQPLLVTLGSRDQAAYYVKNARYLRSSNVTAVRDRVYINADLTPPEAKAAYELRLRRKQRQQREQGNSGQYSDQPTTTSTNRVRLVYRSTAANMHHSTATGRVDVANVGTPCGAQSSTMSADTINHPSSDICVESGASTSADSLSTNPLSSTDDIADLSIHSSAHISTHVLNALTADFQPAAAGSCD